MPWKIVPNEDGKFCVVKKSDGKVVKCHPTREKARSHIAALYANEPSEAKKSIGYGMLKSMIEERVEEIKACGANKPGGGGFAAGNTCARGGGGSSSGDTAFKNGDLVVAQKSEQGLIKGASYNIVGTKATEDPNYKGPEATLKKTGGDYFLRPHQDSNGKYTFNEGNEFSKKGQGNRTDISVKMNKGLLMKHEESGVKAPSPSPYNVALRKKTRGSSF